MNDLSLYFRLLAYVKPYWKVLAASLVMLALLAALEPVFPAIMKPLIDDGFAAKDQYVIKILPYFLVGLFLLRGVLSYFSSYASSWVSNRLVMDLREAMFARMIYFPVSYFDAASSGKIASHIVYDTGAVTGAATNAITIIVRDTLTIIGLMFWLFWLDWSLSVLIVAILPPIFLIVKYFNRRLRTVSRLNQNAMAMITHVVEEAVANNRVVKLSNAETHEIVRFHDANQEARRLAMRTTIAASAITPLIQLVVSLCVALLIGIALNGTDEGGASTAGGFISYLTALLMLLPSIKRLTDVTSVIQRGLAAAEKIFSFLDAEVEHAFSATDLRRKFHGGIEFRNLDYSYDSRGEFAISKFSLKIIPEETVAFVGKSGSGKSTLVSLLVSFYQSPAESIYIDGEDMHELSAREVRRNIAMVSQDVKLFNETVAYNVSYGDDKPNEERVIAALKMASAFDFVVDMPKGIYTDIGQNGVKLSGGQRQRIAIARAFYKDAPILILDEATSALDTESERAIQEALAKLRKKRTSIIIAHRLSTIESADRIVVVDRGAIVEIGTHKDLLSRGGQYANLYNIQFAEL